jgi:uncharacterized protein YlxW (UPF0749 family)
MSDPTSPYGSEPMADDIDRPSVRRWPDPPPGTDYHQSSLWRWRGGRSIVGGGLFALFGLLLVAGAQAYRAGDVLENARPTDLVRILASLESENDRLTQEQRQLEAELSDLSSGTQAQAIKAAEARLQALQILAGTTAVRGPGIRVVIRDPDAGFDAGDMLDAIQELRDAGAEAIELAQRRVVVDTWFANPANLDDDGIIISGELRRSPYTILAIGDPQTLGTALQIPGGVVDTVESVGGRVEIDRRDELDITSTVPLETPEYAEPVSEK